MLRVRLAIAMVPVIVIASSIFPVHDSSAQSPYRLRTSVMGAGGAGGASTGFKTQGTLGQHSAGKASAGGMNVYSGFWKSGWKAILTGADVPVVFTNALYQNYPNPFNPSTTIEYMVGENGPVEITVFNVKGQRVRTLVREVKPPGRYNVQWDGVNDRGRTVSTGIYFYRMQIGRYRDVKKMLLLK
jgi:hypothetical protein